MFFEGVLEGLQVGVVIGEWVGYGWIWCQWVER